MTTTGQTITKIAIRRYADKEATVEKYNGTSLINKVEYHSWDIPMSVVDMGKWLESHGFYYAGHKAGWYSYQKKG